MIIKSSSDLIYTLYGSSLSILYAISFEMINNRTTLWLDPLIGYVGSSIMSAAPILISSYISLYYLRYRIHPRTDSTTSRRVFVFCSFYSISFSNSDYHQPKSLLIHSTIKDLCLEETLASLIILYTSKSILVSFSTHKDRTKLVVWNPYWGQTRWIEPTHNSHRLDFHLSAIGYDKSSESCRSYKILRFVDLNSPTHFVEVKIYDLNSDSWRVLHVVPDGKIFYHERGVSLKGNTYWFARGKPSGFDDAFLVCFDFTSERFGPPLPLPFEWYFNNAVGLSSVREEQLAILYMHRDSSMLEIWITTKIEPNVGSWSNKVFLSLDMMPLVDLGFQPSDGADASFFIDEEKKVAVVFGKDIKEGNRYIDITRDPTHNVVYIIGVDGSFKKSYLGESPYLCCHPLGCSYVPSLVQLN